MTVLHYGTMVIATCTELVPNKMETNQEENNCRQNNSHIEELERKKQTEFATMMRTIKHHYLFKVYLPMYRLIHMTPQERFRNKNDVRILNITSDHNHARKLETCVNGLICPKRPRTLLPTIVPSSKRFVTLKHNRSRNCVHIMKLIPEYPNLNNNGEVISPESSPESSPSTSSSSSCASSPASTPRSLSPPLLSPTDLEHYSKNSVTFYSRHIIQSKFHEHLRRKYTKYNNRNDLKTLILQSRRNDREEIRRKLAMGSDDVASEGFYGGGGGGDRGFKKPSLQSRLQSGMHLHGNNLQICFMNEATSDHETAAETEDKSANTQSQQDQSKSISGDVTAAPPTGQDGNKTEDEEDEDFSKRTERLQMEAKMALAQVRPMAHMQLMVEKQMKKSPQAEVVGLPVRDLKKRAATQGLRDMNVAQLQVLVNDLHTQIENLNEELMQLLVDRDNLHMEQDSKLVDIEDLTRRFQEAEALRGKPIRIPHAHKKSGKHK